MAVIEDPNSLCKCLPCAYTGYTCTHTHRDTQTLKKNKNNEAVFGIMPVLAEGRDLVLISPSVENTLGMFVDFIAGRAG